jgi:hypothetical protein
MAGRALLTIGRHDAELTERLASLLEYAESLGENTVVVTEENAHRMR